MNSNRAPGGLSPHVLLRLARAVERFLRVEIGSAGLLLIATGVAFVWANVGAASYRDLWEAPLGQAPLTLRFIVNDGLMALFFLLVGLELRAELRDGVLSQWRFATLPILAALGGVVVPAVIFLSLNGDPLLRRGWAVPIATDIAFSAAALALLGRRIPAPLRVLLLALAIVDDIAAVVVIAVGYSGGIAWTGLVIAGCGAAALLGLQQLGVRRAMAYWLPGCVLWFGFWRAGVHPTLAGVVLGVLVPASTNPAGRFEDALHPWVAYVVMPLFALGNAGVELRSLGTSMSQFPTVFGGVLLGLVIGKPVGIVLTALACVKLRLAALPPGVGWRHMILLGCFGGMGFTMSIFMADLAFPPGGLLTTGKFAVLVASLLAVLLGLILGRCLLPRPSAANDD